MEGRREEGDSGEKHEGKHGGEVAGRVGRSWRVREREITKARKESILNGPAPTRTREETPLTRGQKD